MIDMLRDMLRTATAIVLVAATCSGVEAAMRPLPEGDRSTFTVRITEDDPRWDCETMGNMVCGDDVTRQNVHDINGTIIGHAIQERW